MTRAQAKIGRPARIIVVCLHEGYMQSAVTARPAGGCLLHPLLGRVVLGCSCSRLRTCQRRPSSERK